MGLLDKCYLDIAEDYALHNTGCIKVHVGCVIIDKNNHILGIGANKSIPNCKKKGMCHRIELYGENSKAHRLPSDCNAVHSEIDAIIDAKCNITGATAYVTRYPCEACARALVESGIKKIVYGRTQEISELTKEILKEVEVVWEKDWDSKDALY